MSDPKDRIRSAETLRPCPPENLILGPGACSMVTRPWTIRSAAAWERDGDSTLPPISR